MLSSLLLALLLMQAAPPADTPKPPEAKPSEKDEAPVVTHHEIRVSGRPLKYTVTTGMMPIRDAKGDTEAHIFFMAYTLDGVSDASRRPLMFSFNGGPGSASVWLHLGAIGPKRVVMLANGEMPSPPFHLVDNEYTWLDQSDLVFIDPVGTGYSRPTKPELGKKFWNLRGDIESVGEFIRMYLTRYERWTSPLFLVGESYGTTRAAGLSGYLIDRGIAFNGIVLVSSILNFQTLSFGKGNDLPYVLYLPSYTATAWYHHKLPPDLERDLRKTLKEVEGWAETGYAEALAKGDRLTAAERQATIDRLARYTGLEPRYIDNSNLRVPIFAFTKELLRDQKRTVGRLDSRFKGVDESAATGAPEYDPSLAAIRPPYTTTFNNYVRGELGYKTDLEYYILGEGITSPWEWGPSSSRQGFPDTSDDLRSAFAKNPYMKLYVASGCFDLATPYFATEYTLTHMGLDPKLRGNIRTGEYEAGHMVYIDSKSLEKLKREVAGFLENALK
ncbi:MAG: peptidase S10 [Acidobacteriia bacterium]|nr:peptidase S10 [Terriglobia bacterium]